MSDRPDRAFIYRDLAGEWRFSVVAPNGEPIAYGEGYKRRASAETIVDSRFPDAQKIDGRPEDYAE